MALINCPECGKEISDKSQACIHCGYPLNAYANIDSSSNPLRGTYYLFGVDMLSKEEFQNYMGKELFNDYMTFIPKTATTGNVRDWIGISEKEYTIVGNSVNINSDTYVFMKNLMSIEEYFYSGSIPEGETFNADIESNGTSIRFTEDGLFTDSMKSSMEPYRGIYMRSGDYIILDYYSDEVNWNTLYEVKYIKNYFLGRSIEVIIDGRISYYSYIHESELDKIKQLFNQPLIQSSWERTRENRNTASIHSMGSVGAFQPKAPWETTYYSFPCPYCGKNMVRPAKWDDKRLSIAFWGALLSPKTGTRYKCDNCKKMWS